MVITKKLNLDGIFVFLFLVLFPFGQIIRIGIFQPIDIVVGLAAIYSILSKQKKPEVFKFLNGFLVVALISWIFSFFIFGSLQILYGSLYLIRLAAYFYFLIYVWNFARQKGNCELLVKSLLLVSIVSAIIGWIQFFAFPDIKPLFIWGWDMHLFRLVGSFLDPTYLGLIIVFGLILSMNRFIDNKDKKYFFITLFLLISLAFTYSRASYLAFFAGLIVIAVYKKVFKQLFLLAAGLVVMVFILPTARNHSIELFRSFSATAKVENYQSTLKIFSKSPVFGIGYDNMCLAYNKFVSFQKISSHSCSGSDSSLLFILATTGIVGFIVFVSSVWNIWKSLIHNSYFIILISSFAALFVHSLFSNSIFYPWVFGWMIILLAISLIEVHGN